MFDDNNQTPGGVPPSNLPLGEPEDIFAGTPDVGGGTPPNQEPAPAATPSSSAAAPFNPPPSAEAENAAANIPTAMETGRLTPVGGDRPESSAPTMAEPMATPSMAGTPAPGAPAAPAMHIPPKDMSPMKGMENNIKSPKSAKGIMIFVVVILVIVGILGLGWFAYSYFFTSEPASTPLPTTNQNNFLETSPRGSGVDFDDTPPVVEDTTILPNGTTTIEDGVTPGQTVGDIDTTGRDTEEVSFDDSVLFGEAIDADSDNLDNAREQILGTDPANWDTDGDELSDGDEVIIWKTDPLNPDTDGDTYMDGVEVKNGYNPAGDGRIFEPPTEEDITGFTN